MKEKRFTSLDFAKMTSHDYKYTMMCIRVGAFRLLGLVWKSKIEWYEDPATGGLVFRYE